MRRKNSNYAAASQAGQARKFPTRTAGWKRIVLYGGIEQVYGIMRAVKARLPDGSFLFGDFLLVGNDDGNEFFRL